MTSRTRKVLFFAAFGSVILFFSGIMSLWIVSVATPEDSPRARMFRTEADLRALRTAVETYKRDHGIYPPPGPEGLAKAMAHLSRNVEYHAGGAPLDGWAQPFQYVPAYAYEDEDSQALRGDDGFYASDAYQLYSPGMDGNPGFEETLKQRDNIVSWDENQTWRTLYSDRQRTYLLNKGRRQ